MRRRYRLVLGGMFLTVLGTVFAFTQPALLAAVAKHPFITFLRSVAPLLLATRARTSFPANILLVLLFIFTVGIWISPLMFYYTQTQPQLLPQAGLLTMATFGVLTGYAWVSKRDFSAFGSFFVVGLWVLIATALLNLFLRNETASLWISAWTLLVFSGLLIFDTWRLRYVYGPDQNALAAVQIHLDLQNMFLATLHLRGGGGRTRRAPTRHTRCSYATYNRSDAIRGCRPTRAQASFPVVPRGVQTIVADLA